MKSPAVARRIIDAIARHYPDADTELHYRNPFELLVATILSAQSTDARVNLVTPSLFARFPDARALAGADQAELENLIRATGFFRQKSRSLIGMSTALVNDHGGSVPASMAELTRLPGVGRKTANVVLGHALGVPGLPVDRHVLRVTNRLGLVHSDDPVAVESALTGMVPQERWTKTSDCFILHGRRICRPTPLCPRCNARKDCDYAISGTVTKPAKGRRPAPRQKSKAATTSKTKPKTTAKTRPKTGR